MSNCEDLFQQINSLQNQRKGLADSHTTLSSIDEDPRPERRFVFRTKDGQAFETNFDDLWKQLGRDPLAQQEWANAAAEAGYKPVGSEGQFENFSQMVNQMGMDNAQQLGGMLTAMTGEWERLNPKDFNAVTAINDKPAFMAQLSNAFADARINIDQDALGQAISKNVAPFLGILNNQTKLRVFADVTRNNLQDSIGLLKQHMAETGVAPTREAKVAFLDSYAKAIFAHRAERIARRRSGQLLNNLQRLVEEDPGAQGSLWHDTGMAAKAEAGALADEIIAMTPAEMVKEGSLAQRVVEAADKGAAGLSDIDAIQQTIKLEGVDSLGGDDSGWEQIWRRNAKAAYKDSILFNPRTQLVANYLSQKIVFAAEGVKKIAGDNAWRLYEGRARELQGNLLGGDPEALAKAKGQPIYVTPLATGFFRDAMKAQLDGSRIAVEAALRAESVIKQSWGESIQKGFLEGDTPFAGDVDYFQTRGNTMDLDTQYKAAQEVMNDPLDPKRFLFQLRDKLHVGLKLLGNKGIEQATGQRLPVYSALQALTAVDQRAGLRVFMTDRANELMLEQASKFPDRTLKEWGDAVDQQLQDQLYQATPSKQNISDAREQFGLAKDEMSDDEIASWLAAERAGYPVLATPEQLRSKDVSVALRMQEKRTDGVLGAIDRAVTPMRGGDVGDVALPFWRSPYNQTIWDISLANPLSPATKVAQVAWNLPQGKVTPKMLAEAQASSLVWLSLAGSTMALRSQGAIVGNGPLDPNMRKQWIQRLNAEGKVPNSIFGIPFNMGGIPVLNSMFLLADAMDVIDQGGVSQYDQINAFQGLLQVGAGAIMRMPGFRQVQMTYDAFAMGNENAFKRLAMWTMNGQANPASGVERMAEWATGTMANDLQQPRTYNSNKDRFDLDQLPSDHPLRNGWDTVRSWVYQSNPGISHWMGTRVKETTWLGRPLRRPDGIFRGEWPIGVPGIWEFDHGDNKVERNLERLQLLDPPSQLMSGRLGRSFMTPELEEEYNNHLGAVKPSVPFSQDPRWGGSAVWRSQEMKVGTPYGPDGQRVEVDLTHLMDQATQGKTVRDAINYVMNSRQWKQWERNPRTTTDPKVRDMTNQMRQNQPGPTLIKKIKDYYAHLAQGEVEKSNTPGAIQWKADEQAGLVPQSSVMQLQNQLQQSAN